MIRNKEALSDRVEFTVQNGEIVLLAPGVDTALTN
jgi:hypothetical protein